MGSSGRWMLWTLCVCFSALENAALRVAMRESSLEAVQGDEVLLPCSFFTSSPLSRLNVIWTLAPFSSPETPKQVIEDPSLIGRVGFTGIPWSADISLNDTLISDAGIYRCMVNNPPETADPGIGELELSVLAPPSLPVCQWDGDIDCTLSCSVAEGIPTPEIRWDKLNPEEIALPINMDGDLSGSVQIVNAVLLTLSMSLVLLALMVLVLWLHRTGQDGRWRERKEEEEEESYNEIRYTPSLMKRSFRQSGLTDLHLILLFLTLLLGQVGVGVVVAQAGTVLVALPTDCHQNQKKTHCLKERREGEETQTETQRNKIRDAQRSDWFESSSDPRSSEVARFSTDSPFSSASRLLPSADSRASFFSPTSTSMNKRHKS
ncbi:hypothetical protein F7725_006703 [Dissostichus mawsoni]|uniref:Ig-like domain-containing protein n=1 Tax=Dissostichus mawsoni TaxID=36200 RepID=A0A7J5XVB1_DISMA|nr:hypothetical protein F7725_006703 [Dissostichus mawsoni]